MLLYDFYIKVLDENFDNSILISELSKISQYRNYSKINNSDYNIVFEDISWKNFEKDMKKLSKKFPDIIFEVKKIYEDECQNILKYRFKNGKMEVVKAKIVFPEFKNIK